MTSGLTRVSVNVPGTHGFPSRGATSTPASIGGGGATTSVAVFSPAKSPVRDPQQERISGAIQHPLRKIVLAASPTGGR